MAFRKIALAGLVLGVVGCASHPVAMPAATGTPQPAATATLVPAGPNAPPSATNVLQIHQLGAAIVLQAIESSPLAGKCPAGSTTLSWAAAHLSGSGQCYRALGKPLTITSAAVSWANTMAGSYALLVAVPLNDDAALAAITMQAAQAKAALAIIVAGKTWALPLVLQSFTRQVEIPLQSRNEALQLQRMLISGT